MPPRGLRRDAEQNAAVCPDRPEQSAPPRASPAENRVLAPDRDFDESAPRPMARPPRGDGVRNRSSPSSRRPEHRPPGNGTPRRNRGECRRPPDSPREGAIGARNEANLVRPAASGPRVCSNHALRLCPPRKTTTCEGHGVSRFMRDFAPADTNCGRTQNCGDRPANAVPRRFVALAGRARSMALHPWQVVPRGW